MTRPLPWFVILIGLTGCAHRVSWSVQPAPSYQLPLSESMLAVIAEGRGCKDYADALVMALAERGMTVRADAPIRLEVERCDGGQDVSVEVELGSSTMDSRAERRRYTLRGWSTADMAVVSPGGNSVRLTSSAERTVKSAWVGDTSLEIPRALTLSDALAAEVADGLANQLAPLPVAMHRRMYRDAEPGSAKDLHNQAVVAEQKGDLFAAMQLARQAEALDSTRAGQAYIEELRQHALTVGAVIEY